MMAITRGRDFLRVSVYWHRLARCAGRQSLVRGRKRGKSHQGVTCITPLSVNFDYPCGAIAKMVFCLHINTRRCGLGDGRPQRPIFSARPDRGIIHIGLGIASLIVYNVHVNDAAPARRLTWQTGERSFLPAS